MKYLVFSFPLIIIGSLFMFAHPFNIQSLADQESPLLKGIREKFQQFQQKSGEDLLYIQTDKTLYVPGETVWLSAFIRDEKTLKPSEKSDIVHLELINPKGGVEQTIKVIAKEGLAEADFEISKNMVGGIYKIKGHTIWQKNNDKALLFEKEITIQKVIAPRIKMKLDFEKKAYGKGDLVSAEIKFTNNTNKPITNQRIEYLVLVEGKEVIRKNATTSDSGSVKVNFNLPLLMKNPDARLTVLTDYEGISESIQRSIPVVLNQISMQFFPEGGDMINGVKTRLAFRAVNEFGKSADVEGEILDQNGNKISRFNSFHFGMGSVEFTPQNGKSYTARITKPIGIEETFPIMDALNSGYLLQAKIDNDKISFTTYCPFNETLNLFGQIRGNVVLSKSINATKGINTFSVNTKDFPIGVAQFTLFDSKGQERSERLVFVNRNKQLNIQLKTDKTIYLPREKVNISVRTTDENGLPIASDFALSVVDDNLLSFADDKQGNLLSKILLEPMLNDNIEEPSFYFDLKNEKSASALDLLMLTAGWRKYSWKQISKSDFNVQYPGERAIFSGLVIDANNGKPLEGATLLFREKGIKAISNKEGKFEFKNLDLSENKTLEVSFAKFPTQTFTINDYNENFTVYLNQYYYRPMSARGGAKGAVMEMDMVAMPAAVNDLEMAKREGLQEKVVEKKNKEIDLEALPGDVIEDKDEDAKDNAEDIEPGYKVDDARDKMFRKDIEKPAAVNGYYKHKEFPVKLYKTTFTDSIRDDYRTTLYWNGHVETDNNGKAQISFCNGDAITSYKVIAEGFSNTGQIGRVEQNYATLLPLTIDVKIPVALTSGDKTMIPVVLKNNSKEPISATLQVQVPKCLIVQNMQDKPFSLQPNESKLIYINASGAEAGIGKITLTAKNESIKESFSKEIEVVSKGFPATASFSGQELTKEFKFTPSNVIPGTFRVNFNAYPNILTQLMSGVESILREPHGCFEQTSSSNYPNIIVLDYLKTTQQVNKPLEEKCNRLLEDGYKKLISFETSEKGFEWFGAAPAHEALTAYGLMEFVDMKKVYPKTDQQLIERTKKLLMDKRDGNGGFKRNPRALDAFGGADEDITNAYIVYSLTEAGEKDIEKELKNVVKNVKESRDPYTVALAANACFNVGDEKTANDLLDILYKTKIDGRWIGKKHSITRSTGKSLEVETSALVLLAMLKTKTASVPDIALAVKFLSASNTGYGGFGSTQATILALKSLTKFAEYSKKTDESGIIEIYVNGVKKVEKAFEKGETNNIEISGIEKFIGVGNQTIKVQFKDCKNALPYAMAVQWSTSLPQNSKECVLQLETSLSKKTTRVGESNRLNIQLINKTDKGQPMSMALISIPSGFSAQPNQLKELTDKKVFDFYEISGNNIAFYYRSLAPGESKQINLDLKAEIPGEYEAQSSSAYLYYTSEHKFWKAMERVFIEP